MFIFCSDIRFQACAMWPWSCYIGHAATRRIFAVPHQASTSWLLQGPCMLLSAVLLFCPRRHLPCHLWSSKLLHLSVDQTPWAPYLPIWPLRFSSHAEIPSCLTGLWSGVPWPCWQPHNSHQHAVCAFLSQAACLRGGDLWLAAHVLLIGVGTAKFTSLRAIMLSAEGIKSCLKSVGSLNNADTCIQPPEILIQLVCAAKAGNAA